MNSFADDSCSSGKPKKLQKQQNHCIFSTECEYPLNYLFARSTKLWLETHHNQLLPRASDDCNQRFILW